MNTTKLILALNELGIQLRLEGDQLRYRAPKGALTPPLRQQIIQHKVELIAFLRQIQEAEDRPTIEPLAIESRLETPLPLSFAQQRLWFLDQLETGAAYNMADGLRLQGQLNINALERALEEIVRRHESLRTTFGVYDGEPCQIIHAAPSIELSVIDLQHLSAKEQETEIIRFTQEEEQTPFDLSQDLMVRPSLLKLAANHHILVASAHHIAWDLWSLGIFVQEFGVLYSAFVREASQTPSLLPALPIQYADFAAWQRSKEQQARLDAQLAYWKKQLHGAPQLHQLPTDHPRGAIETFRGRVVKFSLDATLTQQLKALTQQAGTTLFMTLLSAYFVLLSRYSGQTDLVVGTLIANRNRKEIEPLIGFFVNTLALRANLSAPDKDEDEGHALRQAQGAPTFWELLAQVKQITQDAYTHQDLPFERLVDELELERNLSHNPLVQTVFALQNAPMDSFQLPGLQAELLEVETTIVHMDMEIHLVERETEAGTVLEGEWLYNTDLFDSSTIERMAAHYEMLLCSAVAEPRQPISQLSLLTESERHQILIEWNDTASGRSENTHQCVHERFEEQVERTPEAIAVRFDDRATNRARIGGKSAHPTSLTYRQLNQRANQLAHYLQSLGVGPETLVAICIERSIEMMVGILGVLKAGGAYIPIDPTYPQERIAFMLDDAQVQHLLTSERISAHLPTSATPICLDREWQDIARYPDENLFVAVQPNNLAYCIYTSGSTGRPKGTLIEHRGLSNYLNWALNAYRVSEGSGAPVNTSISFDATITSLFLPLLAGKKVVLLPEENELEALSELLQSGEAYSLVKLTPTHLTVLSQLLDVPTTGMSPGTKKLDVGGAAQYFIIGGEALLESNLTFWRTHAPQTRFINEYGPTETVVGCCVYDGTERGEGSAVSIGRPIANTQLYILDANLQPVPVGVPGILYIGGAGVARGYLNRPELTKERFVPNPFASKGQPGRLYKTGDLCRYLPDGSGNIEYLGREDHQVKIRGYRIELGEIENALLTHQQIKECVVNVQQSSQSASIPTNIRHCVQCGLPSNHPEANLDNESVCGVCRKYAKYKEKAQPYFRTMAEFQRLVEEMKQRRSGQYDCMMLLSGGKDSTYVLAQLVNMGLKVLSFTLDNGFISEGAKENIRRVVDALGVDHIFGTTPAMNAIFKDSLIRHSNVCQGCFKAIYTLSTNIAHQHDIKYIVTGLSRGQIFEDRLQPLFYNQLFDVDEIDRIIIEARKAYHRMDDVVSRRMDVELFQKDETFEQIQFIDFYRYCDVELSEMLAFLDQRLPWVRPSDTGRSTNCLINEVGIYVHQKERGYHNYALPYSWDVILGHKERDAAMEELDDDINEQNVHTILEEIDYDLNQKELQQTSKRLIAYYVLPSGSVSPNDIPLTELRKHLSSKLPDYMIPASFIRLDDIPMTPNGKIDRQALPTSLSSDHQPSEGIAVVPPTTAVEQTLVNVWSQVLNLDIERVGIHNNFFTLGGDSIMSIQIVSRARQAGLSITPRQLFQHQTIAELARIIPAGHDMTASTSMLAEQGVVTGLVRPTPILHWFFEQQLAEPHHFNQALLLKVDSATETKHLRQAVAHLLRHHDALRLRLDDSSTELRLQIVEPEPANGEVPFQSYDFSTIAEAEQSLLIEEKANQLQRSLNLTTGPLLQVAFFQLGSSTRLLIIIHHLVVDGVSWRILLEDFISAYQQLSQGQAVQLPPKTTSFQQWARMLSTQGTQAVADEVDYWHTRTTEVVTPFLRSQRSRVSCPVGTTVTTALPASETELLLTDAQAAYNTQINDLLLTALVQTFAEWTGQDRLWLNLEGHGREDLFDGIDLSRTVGWFTTIFPVLLQLPADEPDDMGAAIKSIKEQVREIPRKGIGYGILRYLSSQVKPPQKEPEVSFNYLGQLDQTVQGPWTPANEPIGATISPQNRHQHLIDITAVVLDGQLQVEWAYRSNDPSAGTSTSSAHRSGHRFSRSRIEQLANQYIQTLSDLIRHCQAPESSGYTPSDFVGADLEQDELDALLAEYSL